MKELQRIRNLREDKDLTQHQISDLLGMKQQQYARYEKGENKLPLELAVTLAKLFDVSIDYLIGLSNNPTHFRKDK